MLQPVARFVRVPVARWAAVEWSVRRPEPVSKRFTLSEWVFTARFVLMILEGEHRLQE